MGGIQAKARAKAIAEGRDPDEIIEEVKPVQPKGDDGLTPRERSDLHEAQVKAKRDANPEVTREVRALQLLKERASTPEGWKQLVEDIHLRSWSYLYRSTSITMSDYAECRDKIEWRDLHGSRGVTRKTMWFAKEGCTCPYHYGQESVVPQAMPPWFVAFMRRWLESFNFSDDGDSESRFPDCCNLNLYDSTQHSVAWHSDDEPLFKGKVQDTRIISVSLGGPGKFEVGIRAPRRGGILLPERDSIQRVTLEHGDICTMEGFFQRYYVHQVKKGSAMQPRVNATFRFIAEHDAGCPMRSRK